MHAPTETNEYTNGGYGTQNGSAPHTNGTHTSADQSELTNPESGHDFDVIVVGGGNAALCTALSAHETGARVLVLESASKKTRGGNSRFAGTVFRACHTGIEQVRDLVCEEGQADAAKCTMGPYTTDAYQADLADVSHGRNDKVQSAILVAQGWQTMQWMKEHGVEWELPVRKYHNMDGLKQSGQLIDLDAGAPVMVRGGGVALVGALWKAVEDLVPGGRMTVWYDSPAHELISRGDSIYGVRVRHRDQYSSVYGKVVLASGGFSANPAMRRQYLGEGWDLVLVRGSKYNTGTMLNCAIAAGARPVGHWGAAHASPQDANGPLMGDIDISPMMPRYAYQYGITVNINGERFFDEGEDNFGKTYAKTGKKIGDQPSAKAFQLFDQKTLHLLPKRYETQTPVVADTLEKLAEALHISPVGLLRTVQDYNAACPEDISGFEPTKNDGLKTRAAASLKYPKSNWALKIDKAPFVAYAVACGITFTYGGIATDDTARVLNNEGRHMPNLWAVGEISGGLFYHNYPGGAGLTKGAVFGRIAGREAALAAKGSRSAK